MVIELFPVSQNWTQNENFYIKRNAEHTKQVRNMVK